LIKAHLIPPISILAHFIYGNELINMTLALMHFKVNMYK